MSERRSIWTWIGLGCVGLTALIVVVTVVGGLWLDRGAKRWERELKDPEVRTQKALDVLGAERLPDGYHAVMSMTIPFVLEMAMLSSEPVHPESGSVEIGERGLIYVEYLNFGQDVDALREYFEGRTDDDSILRRNGIHIETDEIIGRGVVERADADLLYVAQRGDVSTQGVRADGLTSVVLVQCPEAGRVRIAIWLAEDPDPEQPLDEADLTGSPADEAALADFFAPFRPCD